MYKINIRRGPAARGQIELARILRAKRGLSLREVEYCAAILTTDTNRAFELPVARKDMADDIMGALKTAGYQCSLSVIEAGEYDALQVALDEVREPFWERSEKLLDAKGIFLPRHSSLFNRPLKDVIAEIERVPEKSTPHLQRAAYFLLEDDAEAASDECWKAIRVLAHGRVPGRMKFAHFLLGCSLNLLGQRQLARAEWEWILQQSPLTGVHEAAVKAGNIHYSLLTATYAMLDRYPAP